MANNPLVSIVIVNYNGVQDTKECIESIKQIDYDNYNIIVVDNASRDNSCQILTEHFPNLILIQSLENLGFTGGNNLGFQKAFDLGAKYIFCLNNDTIVSKNILDELTLFMESNPDFGLIGPLTYYYDDKQTINFAGGHINRNTGLISFFNKEKKVSEITREFVPCNFIVGSAMFISAGLLKDIGGFNDNYFLTSEESELCIKVHDAGYNLGVLNTCCIWHKVSKSMVAESELANYFIFRNKLYFIMNNGINIKYSELLQVLRYYIVCFFSFAIKKKKWGACKGILTGIIDFFLGRVGAGRYGKQVK